MKERIVFPALILALFSTSAGAEDLLAVVYGENSPEAAATFAAEFSGDCVFCQRVMLEAVSGTLAVDYETTGTLSSVMPGHTIQKIKNQNRQVIGEVNRFPESIHPALRFVAPIAAGDLTLKEPVKIDTHTANPPSLRLSSGEERLSLLLIGEGVINGRKYSAVRVDKHALSGFKILLRESSLKTSPEPEYDCCWVIGMR